MKAITIITAISNYILGKGEGGDIPSHGERIIKSISGQEEGKEN